MKNLLKGIGFIGFLIIVIITTAAISVSIVAKSNKKKFIELHSEISSLQCTTRVTTDISTTHSTVHFKVNTTYSNPDLILIDKSDLNEILNNTVNNPTQTSTTIKKTTQYVLPVQNTAQKTTTTTVVTTTSATNIEETSLYTEDINDENYSDDCSNYYNDNIN